MIYISGMRNSNKVNAALGYKGMSNAEIAKAMGTSPQNFHLKLKRDTLTADELSKIADILGAKYISEFHFPDGTTI